MRRVTVAMESRVVLRDVGEHGMDSFDLGLRVSKQNASGPCDGRRTISGVTARGRKPRVEVAERSAGDSFPESDASGLVK